MLMSNSSRLNKYIIYIFFCNTSPVPSFKIAFKKKGFVFRGRVDYNYVVFLKPILGKRIIFGHFTLSEFMCPYFD